jgi:hypothetical protein
MGCCHAPGRIFARRRPLDVQLPHRDHAPAGAVQQHHTQREAHLARRLAEVLLQPDQLGLEAQRAARSRRGRSTAAKPPGCPAAPAPSAAAACAPVYRPIRGRRRPRARAAAQVDHAWAVVPRCRPRQADHQHGGPGDRPDIAAAGRARIQGVARRCGRRLGQQATGTACQASAPASPAHEADAPVRREGRWMLHRGGLSPAPGRGGVPSSRLPGCPRSARSGGAARPPAAARPSAGVSSGRVSPPSCCTLLRRIGASPPLAHGSRATVSAMRSTASALRRDALQRRPELLARLEGQPGRARGILPACGHRPCAPRARASAATSASVARRRRGCRRRTSRSGCWTRGRCCQHRGQHVLQPRVSEGLNGIVGAAAVGPAAQRRRAGCCRRSARHRRCRSGPASSAPPRCPA